MALGDRHSLTAVGSTGRVWYSGTPEVTDYVETDPGQVLVVDLTASDCRVDPHRVGKWSFVRRRVDLNGADDVDALAGYLQSLPDKENTVVKLSFIGTLSLRAANRLEELLDHSRDLFAALETWERNTELAVLPDDADLEELELTGFASEALSELHGRALSGADDSVVARDALGLLYRLAGGAR